MAHIAKEILIDAAPGVVWDAVRDVGQVHRRLVPGITTDCRLEDGARVVTFANGMVLRELIVDVDDAGRRFAYASVGGQARHHNASLQVFDGAGGGSRLVWLADFLPDTLTPLIGGLMAQGIAVMKATVEAASVHA